MDLEKVQIQIQILDPDLRSTTAAKEKGQRH